MKHTTVKSNDKNRSALLKIWLVLRWILLLFLLILLVSAFDIFLDTFGWSTGFGSGTKQVQPNEDYRPGKTLWDWLDLLIVPAILAVGVFMLNWTLQQASLRHDEQLKKIERERSEKQQELERRLAAEQQKMELNIANDRLNEHRLQGYLDRMTDLLLEKKLNSSESDISVRTVARARTLTTIRMLDTERKGLLLRFLYELSLNSSGQPSPSETSLVGIIDLQDVDMRGVLLNHVDLRRADLHGINLCEASLQEADLSWASLHNANLKKADLCNANLHDADLRLSILIEAKLHNAKLNTANLNGANLSGANLRSADLRGASLCGTNMRNVSLVEANLVGADLSGAILSESDLFGANILPIQLRKARNLNGAIMPDGSKFKDGSWFAIREGLTEDMQKPLIEEQTPEHEQNISSCADPSDNILSEENNCGIYGDTKD